MLDVGYMFFFSFCTKIVHKNATVLLNLKIYPLGEGLKLMW